MWTNFPKAFCIAALIVSCTVPQAFAQDAEMTEQQKKDLLKLYYRDFASRIEFSLADKQPLKLLEKPVMSWAGNEGGFSSGDVFVWTLGGRAEVIGCIGSIARPRDERAVFQEFHSLATQPLRETNLEVEGPWGPKKPGVNMKPVYTSKSEDKIEPATNDSVRLAQMRRVARTFNAYMHHPEKQNEERLRVMPQPLYRFDTKALKKNNSNVVDGAIFAYVWSIGTDPELLLLLECHKEGEELVWKYAPVRFTYRVVRLEQGDNEVWKAVRDGGNRNSAYRTTSGGVRTYSEMKETLAKTAVASRNEVTE